MSNDTDKRFVRARALARNQMISSHPHAVHLLTNTIIKTEHLDGNTIAVTDVRTLTLKVDHDFVAATDVERLANIIIHELEHLLADCKDWKRCMAVFLFPPRPCRMF